MTLAALLLTLSACTSMAPVSSAPGNPPPVSRVIVFILENQDYDTVTNTVTKNAIFKQLAAGGALFTNAHGWTHPSYPNYLALVSGDTHGALQDVPQLDLPLASSIADALEAKGKTWKNYAQAYPGAPGQCAYEPPYYETVRYVRRHVPFLSFQNIQKKQGRCENIVDAVREFDPYVATPADRAALKRRLPDFSFYSPDMCNSGHGSTRGSEDGSKDCPFTQHAKNADKLEAIEAWLGQIVLPLLSDPVFMDGTLVIVTFDEPEERGLLAVLFPRNHVRKHPIWTAFFGPMVKTIAVPDDIDHYTVLRTIEWVLRIDPFGENDRKRTPIGTIWK